MRFTVVQDAEARAGISTFLDLIRRNGFRERFAPEEYDPADTNLGVIIMCRQPYHNFKQRIRHSKKDNTLYLDLMLKLDEMEILSPSDKILLVARKMLEEIPRVLSKYPKLEFDVLRFSRDLREWFEKNGVMVDEFED